MWAYHDSLVIVVIMNLFFYLKIIGFHYFVYVFSLTTEKYCHVKFLMLFDIWTPFLSTFSALVTQIGLSGKGRGRPKLSHLPFYKCIECGKSFKQKGKYFYVMMSNIGWDIITIILLSATYLSLSILIIEGVCIYGVFMLPCNSH